MRPFIQFHSEWFRMKTKCSKNGYKPSTRKKNSLCRFRSDRLERARPTEKTERTKKTHQLNAGYFPRLNWWNIGMCADQCNTQTEKSDGAESIHVGKWLVFFHSLDKCAGFSNAHLKCLPQRTIETAFNLVGNVRS